MKNNNSMMPSSLNMNNIPSGVSKESYFYKHPERLTTIEDRFERLHKESLRLNTNQTMKDVAIPSLYLQPGQLYESSLKLKGRVGNMLEKTESMIGKSTSGRENRGIKAFKYLAQRGFDPAKLRKDLGNIEVYQNFEPYEPLGQTNVDGYLKHHYHVVVLTAAEEARRGTVEESRRNLSTVLDRDWTNAKDRLKRMFGTRGASLSMKTSTTPSSQKKIVPPPYDATAGSEEYDYSEPGLNLRKRPLFGDRASGYPSKQFRGSDIPSRLQTYARLIQLYNQKSRSSDGSRTPFAIAATACNKLRSAVESTVSNGEEALKAWHVVTRILGEDEFETNDQGKFVKGTGIGEQQHAALRHEKRQGTGARVLQLETRRRLLRGSIRALSAQYVDYISGRVSGVRDVSAGEFSGVPSVLSDVVRYVRGLPIARKSLTVSGARPYDLFWPILFYLLRCGASAGDIKSFFVDETWKEYRMSADTESRALEDGSSTNSVMRRLCNYCILFHRITCGFKSLSQDTDTEMMAAQTLRTQWHSSRGGKDVSGGYRDAVLNLVSFTDPKLGLPQQDGENANVEDFLWQKLCFVLRPIPRRDRSLNSDGVLASRGNNTTDEFSLRHWANVVINAESSFVEGGKSPFVYFRALLYVLEFERAVSFLATAASRANLDSDKVSWFADAVHIAIAIHHYGALRVTNNVPSSNSTSSSAYLVVQQQTEEASLKLADVFERHLAIFVHGGNLKYAFEYVFVLWQKKVTKKGTSEDLVPSYVLSLMVRILLHANSCDDVLSYLRNRLSKPQLIQVTKVAALRASELGKMKRAIKLWSLPSVGQYEMAVRLLNEQLSIHLFSSSKISTNEENEVGSEQQDREQGSSSTGGVLSRERKLILEEASRFYREAQQHEKIRRTLSLPRAAVETRALGVFLALYEYVDLCCAVPAQYERAIAAMSTNPLSLLIPSRETDVFDCVDHFFRSSQFLREKIPELLLMQMKCLKSLHTSARHQRVGGSRFNDDAQMMFQDDNRKKPVDFMSCSQLRHRAALLLKFASMIERKGFSISDATYSKLSMTHMSME